MKENELLKVTIPNLVEDLTLLDNALNSSQELPGDAN